MQKYKLTIAYDGTDYYGWQRQPDRKTVQGVLENILFRFHDEKISLTGSGRTDAGVHAQGQVAHFQADLRLDAEELLKALNGQLPGDIRILKVENVPSDFHARSSAKSKIYQYRIFNHPRISPFLFRYVHFLPVPLDIAAMQDAAARFIRTADFSPFSSNRDLPPIRTVTRSEITAWNQEIIYTVEANGFLKYMVRTLVGTLLEIGRGKLSAADIDGLFQENRRSLGSPTAPAKGLCLMEVKYGIGSASQAG